MKKVTIYKNNGDVEEISSFIKSTKTNKTFLIITYDDDSELYFVLNNIYKFEIR